MSRSLSAITHVHLHTLWASVGMKRGLWLRLILEGNTLNTTVNNRAIRVFHTRLKRRGETWGTQSKCMQRLIRPHDSAELWIYGKPETPTGDWTSVTGPVVHAKSPNCNGRFQIVIIGKNHTLQELTKIQFTQIQIKNSPTQLS